MKTLYFFALISLCVVGYASAQMQPEIEPHYTQNVPFHQEVISGGYYVDPPHHIEGHPFLFTKNFQMGNITLNGLSYENVPLLYDIQKDQIITFHPVHRKKTLIQGDKINSFTLFEPTLTHFIRLRENPGYIHHKNGIYELVTDGKVQLLCKNYKFINPKKEVGKYSGYFNEGTDYFLKKGESVLLIRKKKKVFEFLELERRPFMKEMRRQNIFFKPHRRMFMSLLTEYYNNQGQ